MYHKNLMQLLTGSDLKRILGTRLCENARGSRVLGACARISFSSANFNLSVEEMLKKWFKIFQDQRISEPLESIANILAHNLHSNKIGVVYANRMKILSDNQIANITSMCDKRLQNMPVQYIVGQWDFREITLKLRPPVFIPRPETEMLVELVLNQIRKNNTNKILELCCGSGAISMALLHQIPNLKVMAVDKSQEACDLTLENAKLLGFERRIQICKDDVNNGMSCLKDKFDLIVSNPPYILSNEIKDLQPEILLYEDLEALDGGADGLNIVKQIFNIAANFLYPGGRLFLEVDPSHPQLIPALLTSNKHLGLSFLFSHCDLSNETRFVEIIKNV